MHSIDEAAVWRFFRMAGNNRLGTPMEKLERIVIARVNSFPLMSLYDLTQRQWNAILRFRLDFPSVTTEPFLYLSPCQLTNWKLTVHRAVCWWTRTFLSHLICCSCCSLVTFVSSISEWHFDTWRNNHHPSFVVSHSFCLLSVSALLTSQSVPMTSHFKRSIQINSIQLRCRHYAGVALISALC